MGALHCDPVGTLTRYLQSFRFGTLNPGTLNLTLQQFSQAREFEAAKCSLVWATWVRDTQVL
jgi:hypothetical protein